MNSMTVEPHKHCIFCGEVIDFSKAQECKSPANKTQTDSTGHRNHAYLTGE